MTTSSEKLSRLVSDKMAYHFPDTKPTVGEVLKVTAAGVDQVNLGFAGVAVPDPINTITYDNTSKEVTITTVAGVTFTVDIGDVNTDNFLKTIGDTAEDTIGFTLDDGTTVVYKPTLDANKMSKKADKTTKLVSKSAQLTLKNPTLAEDVELTLKVGTAAGDLLALEGANKLPTTVIDYLIASENFLALSDTPHNAANPLPSTAKDGDMLMISGTGTHNVVPFGGTTAIPHKLVAGDILRMYGGEWHIISRSQVDSLSAAKVSTTAVGTPSLGSNVQDVISALESRKVPTTRRLISSDINEIRVNGLVSDDMDLDVTFDLVTNVANGILKLDASGQVPISLMPTAALQFHGSMPANNVNTATTRPDGTAWQSGDTILINADGNADVIELGKTAVTTGAVLKSGQSIIRDTAGNWVVAATAGVVNSGDVNISPSLGATHLTQTQLNAVLQHIDNNAVWITGNQDVGGDKKLTGHTTAAQLSVGGTGTEYNLPLTRTSTTGQALVSGAAGAVTWGDVAGDRVSFKPAGVDGVAATTVQGAIADLSTSAMKLVPNANQTLQGDATGNHTILQSNSGVILGDGTTVNQIGKMVTSAGTF